MPPGAAAHLAGMNYPNRFARYLFTGMEDVLGRNGLTLLLNAAGTSRYLNQPPPDDLERRFSFNELAALNRALEQLYGVPGAASIAHRIGRATFAQGMIAFGAFAGMADPSFRTLPLRKCVHSGLNTLAETFTHFSDQETIFEPGAEQHRLIINPSPFAWKLRSGRPICRILVGLTDECLRWSTDGYSFHVHEIACQATGNPACILAINPRPD